jgi:RsiW-degrading membrane proteinase PrsW (M82 family)
MKPLNADPHEQAFVEQALAAAARAQRLDQVRVIVATGAAVSAAIWFAFRPPSPQLGVEATIIVVIGAMIAAATAKLRSLIQHNTNLVLQALASLRPQADSPRSEER